MYKKPLARRYHLNWRLKRPSNRYRCFPQNTHARWPTTRDDASPQFPYHQVRTHMLFPTCMSRCQGLYCPASRGRLLISAKQTLMKETSVDIWSFVHFPSILSKTSGKSVGSIVPSPSSLAARAIRFRRQNASRPLSKLLCRSMGSNLTDSS